MNTKIKMISACALCTAFAWTASASENLINATTPMSPISVCETIDSSVLKQGLITEIWTNTNTFKGDLPTDPAPIAFIYNEPISITSSVYKPEGKNAPERLKIRMSGYIQIREKGDYTFVMEIKDQGRYASLKVGDEFIESGNAPQFLTLKITADAPGFYPIVVRRDANRLSLSNFSLMYRRGKSVISKPVAPSDCFHNAEE